jgi:hypothetical protein
VSKHKDACIRADEAIEAILAPLDYHQAMAVLTEVMVRIVHYNLGTEFGPKEATLEALIKLRSSVAELLLKAAVHGRGRPGL